MNSGELAARYPILFHMAAGGSWPSIREHGLLSTSALLDLFDVRGVQREIVERTLRSESISISHPEYGRAIIRDQKPTREAALLACLDGVSPQDWYTLLNERVFFWLTERRLRTLLGARAYRDAEQTVIAVDAAALFRRDWRHVSLSRINSGSTLYKPVRRGTYTFVHPEVYPEEWWRQHRIAELTVDYAVRNVEDIALSVETWKAGQLLEVLWRP